MRFNLIIIIVVFVSAFYSCKTQPKKYKPPVNNTASTNTSTNNTKEKNQYVVDENTGLKKNKNWKTSLKEGWLDNSSAQALISTRIANSSSKEQFYKEARERLAWLLLIHSYDLQRADRSLAKKLARSKLFDKFGKEELFEQVENQKLYIIVKRSGTALKSDWKSIQQKIEKKEPRLVALKKK